MKKKILSIVLILALPILAMFFPLLLSSQTTFAIIQNSSGNNFVLTGALSSSAKHYFGDANGNSTLVNLELEKNTKFDLEYYVLSASAYQTNLLIGQKSSGWTEIVPTADMQAFIDKGIVYAQVQFTFVQKSNNNQSRIKATLSYGEELSSTIETDANVVDEQITYSTDKILLSGEHNLKFLFETVEANKAASGSNFVFIRPTIKFYTELKDFTFENTDSTVMPGQVITLRAYNDITLYDGNINGDFSNYSKIKHKIEYQISQGSQYASITGNTLSISQDTPNGTEIKVRARCKKNSLTDEYFDWKEVVYTVNAEKVNVVVSSDFEDPATFEGEGDYYSGEGITLSVSEKSGYTFTGWEVYDLDGNIISSSSRRTFLYRATHGQTVKANFIKDITLSGIQIASKQYDGTTNVEEESITYLFSGKEDGHEIYIENIDDLSLTYSSSQVGTDVVRYDDEQLTNIVLGGQDAEIYNLVKQFSGFKIEANPIVKRQISVSINSSEKTYGEKDPAFEGVLSDGTTLAEGEELSQVIALSFKREQGENVGKYAILPVWQDEENGILMSNANYQVLYKQSGANSYLTINQREVSISQIVVANKTYDGKTEATISGYRIDNMVEGDDLSAVIKANFNSAGVGSEKEVVISQVTLQGEDKENYLLKESEYSGIIGNISQRVVTVTAKDIQVTYGSEPEFEYDVKNLAEGEKLQGTLSIDGKDVGIYSISRGTLDAQNPNYQIEFISANCQIIPKSIDVYAKSGQQKEYGDSDSLFEYDEVEGLVGDDVLVGQLSRVEGEEVGDYDIVQGTVTNENNPNYNITFHSSIFQIVKREIVVTVQFLDKVYDGKTEVTYNENFRVQNALPEQIIILEIEANLLSANAGVGKIDSENLLIEVVDKDERHFNYTINYNQEITISKRQAFVIVEDNSKIYGEEDPQIKYEVENLVKGENLTIEILRNTDESGNGENVGRYSYYLGSKTHEENPNYEISMQVQAFLTINAREIVVESENAEKVFGDDDPDFKVLLKEGTLAFDDKLEEILTGSLSREEGESVGSYKIQAGTLSSQNYVISYAGDAVLVIVKRDVYVTFDNIEKIYGDEDPTFTYSVKNDVDGQDIVLDVVRENGEDVGLYKITSTNPQDTRYNIFFEGEAYLTIKPSQITLQAENKFKYYGDFDPELSVIITKGVLKNNDSLSSIMQGGLVREEGENVGSYLIKQGDLSLGKNYEVNFISGNLSVYPLPIEITANNIEKIYGENDPHFAFQLTKGHLVGNDTFAGNLSREEGECVGSYQITIGTLTLGDNYDITFVPGQLEIVKKRITIVPTTTSKIYGEEEGEIEYETIGSLITGDVLEGELKREKPTSLSNPKLYENVGRYKIVSTLSHDNYEIIFGEYYFEIKAREIKIKADDKTITYGQENLPLTYQIQSGEIMEGDSLSGQLYRAVGDNVGKYDIQSSLTLGSNYHIIFTKGVYEILPIKITVKSSNYSKIYGQFDPEFSYEIVEGQLLLGDVIYGSISRESGEDVGTYALINNLTNPNYEITLLPAFLSITPKDVYLVAGVQDKPYDGTAKATIKTPVVSGLIDRNVYLVYDSENCVYFATAEAGDDIPVFFYNITLAGDKADNYHLIYPTDVTGSITYDLLEKDDIVVASPDNANLYFGTSLNYEVFDINRAEMGLNIRQVVQGYNIWLEKDSSIFDVTTSVNIIIDIPSAFADRNNLYVYHKDENGEYTLVSSKRNEAGQLVITTDELGEFVIMTDNDSWIDLSATICVVLLFVLLMIALIAYIRKRATKK